ncbi:MAG: response regulator [Mucilaginibacter sp.]
MKILVIEDNPDIKEILDYILQDEGHEVISAFDGSVLTSVEQIKPDLILTDEILSGPRGSTLCRKLKSDDSTKTIPVVLISGINRLSTIAAECGADAYIEKPFNLDTLTEMIRKFAVK